MKPVEGFGSGVDNWLIHIEVGLYILRFEFHISAVCGDAIEGKKLLNAAVDALLPDPSIIPINSFQEENGNLEELQPSLLLHAFYIQEVSPVIAWLFPILKQYTVGLSLNFFTESIFDMIGLVEKNSVVLEQEGKIGEASCDQGEKLMINETLNLALKLQGALSLLTRETPCTSFENRWFMFWMKCSLWKRIAAQN
ncbi:hypothetical protein ACET3Z_030443 [Daucus carota]